MVSGVPFTRFMIGPKELPASPFDEHVGDCYIEQIRIVNDGAGNAGVTVCDKQAPPISMFTATLTPSESASDTISAIPDLGDNGRPMPGGITWSSSQPGVHGWIKGYYLGNAD